jgi:tetratricopeptide (TPR) repeat protein
MTFLLPSASPRQMIVQDFGLGKIKIAYSRPSIKGRTVFNDNSLLAPLGKLWRTGADNPTLITFSDNVIINNTPIEASTYSLFTIPNATTWVLILNKGIKGIDTYKKADDLLRLTVPVKEMADSTETFTINVQQLHYESCMIQLSWSNVSVEFVVTTNIVDRLNKSYEAQLESEKKSHFSAARFYHHLGNDNNKALEQISISLQNNPDAYYMHYLKSVIEFSMGDNETARQSAQKTLEAAITAGSDDYKRLAENMLTKL